MFPRLFILIVALSAFAARADDFDAQRIKWFTYLTGGTNHNLADPQVQSLIRGITNTANAQWTNLNTAPGRAYLWSDAASTTDSSDITGTYNHILDMARGYATRGGALYTNAALGADIVGALEWMYANRYNETKAKYDNWWDWEIGSAMSLNDTCVLMHDVLSAAHLANYARATTAFTPLPALTGANLVWKTRVVALRAALMKDSAKLLLSRDALSGVFPYVTNSDGFYTDGSFIQHGKHPYTGGYGAALIASLAPMLTWLKDSPWEVTDPAQTNVVRWVLDAFAPLLYRGACLDMVRGREISRTYNDHSTGRSVVDSAFRIAELAPPAEAARILSFIKYTAQADTSVTWNNFGGLSLLSRFRALLADPAIAPAAEPVFHKQFPGMDGVMHTRPGWGLALRMSSSRVYNYESISGENLRGWFTGDGVTYLYNSDVLHFSDAYWPTVNPYRLPGTTVDTASRTNGSGQSTAPATKWVGGASLDGAWGVTGMELTAFGSSLTARKSWFCFDDEVVCLGAGITSTNPSAIETTVENRRLTSAGTNEFRVNGISMPVSLGWSNTLAGVTSCWLNAVGGYYFPGAANLKALREARTGAWRDISDGGPTGLITRNYLTLWMDHGSLPASADYAYVLLPNKSASETDSYAIHPSVVILENSPEAQAVRETSLNLLAVNFWNAATKSVDFITCNQKASVIVRETSGGLHLGIADPTQTNGGIITLTLNRSALALGFADPGVTVSQLTPTIQLTVNMSGRRGGTARAVFAYTTNTPPALAFASPVDGAIVPAGTVPLIPDATDPDGGGVVTQVEFFAGTSKLGETTQPPFTLDWAGVPPGFYTLILRATDNTGRRATSAPVHVTVAAPQTVIAPGSVWRFLDNGSNQGTAWRTNGFNDAAWKSGPSQLGFGELDEATLVASNRQFTTYFRCGFTVPDISVVRGLNARLIRDDGAVVYLNGTEVWRDNLPTTPEIASNIPANSNINGNEEGQWLARSFDPALLRSGTNVIAVEIHQHTVTSSDLSFDFLLEAMTASPSEPRLTGFSFDGSLTLTWPADLPDFRVVCATNFAPPIQWTATTNEPFFLNGTWRTILPLVPDRTRFYRLELP